MTGRPRSVAGPARGCIALFVLALIAALPTAQAQPLAALLERLSGEHGPPSEREEAVEPWPFDWHLDGRVATRHDGPGHLSLSAELTYALDGGVRASRRAAERRLAHDLEALRAREAARRRQFELIAAFCRVRHLDSAVALIERRRDLATDAPTRRRWQAEAALLRFDLANAHHDLERAAGRPVTPPADGAPTCDLAEIFAFDLQSTGGVDPIAHPAVVAAALEWSERALYRQFLAPDAAELFVQGSLHADLDPSAPPTVDLAIGARIPIAPLRAGVAASATVDVTLDGAALRFALRSDRFDDRPEGAPLSPLDREVAEAEARVRWQLELARLELALAEADEGLAWARLGCEVGCPFEIAAVADRETLARMADALSASQGVERAQLRLLDALPLPPSRWLLDDRGAADRPPFEREGGTAPMAAPPSFGGGVARAPQKPA